MWVEILDLVFTASGILTWTIALGAVVVYAWDRHDQKKARRIAQANWRRMSEEAAERKRIADDLKRETN